MEGVCFRFIQIVWFGVYISLLDKNLHPQQCLHVRFKSVNFLDHYVPCEVETLRRSTLCTTAYRYGSGYRKGSCDWNGGHAGIQLTQDHEFITMELQRHKQGNHWHESENIYA